MPYLQPFHLCFMFVSCWLGGQKTAHQRLYTHTHTHTRKYTDMFTHTVSMLGMHNWMFICIHVHVHTHTHTYTHTHTHKHTHTHTHTHTLTHSHNKQIMMYHKYYNLTVQTVLTDSLSVAASVARSASAWLSASFARCSALMASDFKLACVCVYVCSRVCVCSEGS